MQIKKETKNLDRKKIIILIPYWSSYGTKEYAFNRIKKFIPKEIGYIYYYFSRDLINDNPHLTKRYFDKFLSQLYEDINIFEKDNKEVNIYAQSLGGLFAMIIADRIKIKRIMLICPGDNLAESFWGGLATKDIKEKMEKNGMTLNLLKDVWKKISPDFYFKKKALSTNFCIKLSTRDNLIPYKNGRNLIDLLKKKKVNFTLCETFLSHPLILLKECIFPKKSIDFLIKS